MHYLDTLLALISKTGEHRYQLTMPLVKCIVYVCFNPCAPYMNAVLISDVILMPL